MANLADYKNFVAFIAIHHVSVRFNSSCRLMYTGAVALQLAFVFEVGGLDMVHQPVLGEVDRIIGHWNRQTLQLSHEVSVQLFVGPNLSIVGFLHHTLLIREMLRDNRPQMIEGTSITWSLGDVEDSLEQTLVLIVNKVIEHFEGLIPDEWFGDIETHGNDCMSSVH